MMKMSASTLNTMFPRHLVAIIVQIIVSAMEKGNVSLTIAEVNPEVMPNASKKPTRSTRE
jgi:hypothetical protein